MLTASPVQLVVMLYDGAGRFLRQAIALYDQGDAPKAAVALGRSRAIIEELLATLDLERGGEIASRLQGLYVYFLKEMTGATIDQRSARLQEILPMIADLRASWAELAAQQG